MTVSAVDSPQTQAPTVPTVERGGNGKPPLGHAGNGSPGKGQHAACVYSGRQRVTQPVTNRVRRDGKFFRLGTDKFYVKGVTYGPFAPNADGDPLPRPDLARKDFEQIKELGANCIRIYHVPPTWFLDMAQEMGLKIFLDVAWPKNLAFVGDAEVARQAHEAVRHAARTCGNHPAVFALSVVNEIPPDLVRFMGKGRVEQFIDELVATAKAHAPDCLITFANFPTTEYVQPRAIDFVCFNVYLHDDKQFRNYLARLQNIAGDKPLMLGEYGIDTFREYPEEKQAEILTNHVKAVFDEGCVGTFIFSYTDDWYTHGWQIEDWAFGVVKRERDPHTGHRIPKPAYHALAPLFHCAPQLASEKLPMVSVIICSYNGASTIESCLRSMERLRYPEYEVIFVDDGSTDGTQEILKKFPWVRNIRQKNMGLSYARNVGMNAARGEVIIYTDSDCEADEDWLYYMVLALVRSSHAGMGGPNLIPDEGSWVADCVGLSPGGPTHVMINDREAEHVPGCNMAYYTRVAKEINGFDPQFRAAGDDVDFIWRLQHAGYTIGFSPAAQVWHYRRNTVRAYLKQQKGYGIAEALLKYKHPDHFNTLGASHWRGKIYGTDQIGVRMTGDVVYHGLFGTGLFQTIYRRPASLVAAMLMSIEWHLLYGFIALLGVSFPYSSVGGLAFPLLWVAALMAMVPMVLAGIAAYQQPMPKHRHWLTRPLIAFLHYRQPLTRGWARYSVRLKAKVLNEEAKGYRRPQELPFDPKDRGTLLYWSKWYDRITLLEKIQCEVKKAGWKMRIDSGWADYDMEIYGSRYVKIRILTATEHHHNIGMMTRVRVELKMSKFCAVLFFASCMLAALLLLYMWPFSRTAALIPLTWSSMYLINKWRVSRPVFGLIDEVAERAGFYPVFPKEPDQPEPAPAAAKPEPEPAVPMPIAAVAK
jgi:glycosyltransferase involved in cell wall biosynthesis